MIYNGSCHCGAVRFRFECEPITKGVRCNCSICIRRGNVMSDTYLPIAIEGSPTFYEWGDRMVKFWSCPTCSIHVFAEISGGRYRVNLGCVDGVDPLALDIRLIDGKSFPVA